MTRFVVLLVLLALATVPADAASSRPTARASGVLAVYDQPGNATFRRLLFKLGAGEHVYVLDCTYRARWCEVERLDGKGEGWVDGSYLVGAPAKNAVTPFEFTFNPMDPLGFAHRKP